MRAQTTIHRTADKAAFENGTFDIHCTSRPYPAEKSVLTSGATPHFLTVSAAGKTCNAYAVLHRCMPVFAFLGEPARRMRLALFFTFRQMISRAGLHSCCGGHWSCPVLANALVAQRFFQLICDPVSDQTKRRRRKRLLDPRKLVRGSRFCGLEVDSRDSTSRCAQMEERPCEPASATNRYDL